MSDPRDPWSHNRPGQPARRYVWLALVAAVALFVWFLTWRFPGVINSDADEARVFYLATILVVLASGLVLSRRFSLRESVRNLVLWIGIAAVLGVLFLYQDSFSNIALRLRGEMMPAEPLAVDTNTVQITASEDGNFLTMGEVDGVRVRFAVDTGASAVVLSPQDARRIGVDTASLYFNQRTETANGSGRSAALTVRTLSVGPIVLHDVPVEVNQAPMNTSLLGMSFLRRMKSFEFRGRKLYLHAG